MPDNLSLFDQAEMVRLADPPTPSNGVDTSDAAAEAIAPLLGPLRLAVLRAVCEAEDGLTTFQIEETLREAHQTVSPRVWEMTRKMYPPLLHYSKDTRRRAGPAGDLIGSAAHVVRPTSEGLALYRQLTGAA